MRDSIPTLVAMSTSPSPLSRRSFSLPVTRNTASPDSQLETLFTLDSARIVSFTTSNSPSRPSSSSGISADDDEVGKLSWVSRFETTIAVGPLRIYRAPGSVAFLNCATALRPILPKSQAWCVDGDSKFVLQVRRPQYWRIEVSNKTEGERAKVDELKRVLGDVLLFEKTPCPFQRDFVVELPETPATPVAKRPWKPVQGPSPRPVTPLAQETTLENGYGTTTFGRRASSASPLRQSLLSTRRRNSALDLASQVESSDFESQPSSKFFSSSSNGSTTTISESDELAVILPSAAATAGTSPVPKDSALVKEDVETQETESSNIESDVSDLTTHDDSENFSDATDDSNITPRPRGRPQPYFHSVASEEEEKETQQALNQFSSPITAPPVLSLMTSPPSKSGEASPLVSSAISDSNSSFSSSVESFHTVQSWHSLSPTESEPSSPKESFAYIQDDILLPKRPQHAREMSELTITPESPRVWDLSTATPIATSDRRASSPDPKTPTLINDGSDKSDEEFEIVTPPAMKQGLRHRATTSSNSRRRELSPLPAAVNLFSPTRRRPRHLQTGRHLPTAIIQKTCEILLSPPSHLFHLMLNIASKIAAGEWRGVLLGYGEAVHWDFEDEYAAGGCFEDDYGIGLAPPSSKDSKSQNNSWEID